MADHIDRRWIRPVKWAPTNEIQTVGNFLLLLGIIHRRPRWCFVGSHFLSAKTEHIVLPDGIPVHDLCTLKRALGAASYATSIRDLMEKE